MNTQRSSSFLRRLAKAFAASLLLSLSFVPASAATTSYLIDTGGNGLTTYNGTPYTIGADTYDFGTANNYLSLTVPNLGLATPSVSFGAGNAHTFAFTGAVSAYNIGDTLSQSFLLFNNHGSGNPIGFTLSGFGVSDTVNIEFVSSQNQVVTMTIGAQMATTGNTVTGTSPNFIGNWVSINGLTGSSSYNGQFSVIAGEGSIAAIRITVNEVSSPIPEPSAFAALAGAAILGVAATRRRRA